MKKTNQHLWPEYESPCIWMEAGLIDYKLCEYNLDCENCSFDAVIRNKTVYKSTTPNSRTTRKSIYENYWDKLLKTYTSVQIDKKVYYGSGYWYFEPISATKAIIGIDQLAAKLLPSVTDIIISEKKLIQKGQKICWLVSKYGTIILPSPISSRVLKSNHSFQQEIESKASSIWLYMIESQNLRSVLQKLEQGHKAKTFLEIRQKRILEIIKSVKPPNSHIGQTLPDGGKPVESLEQLLGKKLYFTIISEIFNTIF
jgi:glycine cleavage system H lipoate-binding protein